MSSLHNTLPQTTEIQAIEDRFSSGLYAKHPIIIERGSGACLWDVTGKQYLDCSAGHGVANLGHAHPAIAKAIAEQANCLITLPETFYNSQRALYLQKLVNSTPGFERAFLCNSGTESVEAALKLARLITGRQEIIATMRGFHGRTMGALSATWNKKYRQPFEPLVPGFKHVPYNDSAALDKAISSETAALILEVVQGEGGVYPVDPAYLSLAKDLCEKTGALLIIDEVQTGFGRTGKMFAIEHYAVKPDLLCLAKSIAGGLAMGAVLMNAKFSNLKPGLHASTFGGNPLACAAAMATLAVIESENLTAMAAEKGEYLLNKLSAIQSPLIREVRGLGLMLGIELKQKVTPYLRALEDEGILALPAGLTVMRLLPPLVITYAEIDQVIAGITSVLSDNVSRD